jgi:hypothetical protein
MSYSLMWIDAEPGAVTLSGGTSDGRHEHDNSFGSKIMALAEKAASSHFFPIEDDGHYLAVIVQDDAP